MVTLAWHWHKWGNLKFSRRKRYKGEGLSSSQYSVDSEVLPERFFSSPGAKHVPLTPDHVFVSCRKRLFSANNRVHILRRASSAGTVLSGFRDPHGIRPLQLGKRKIRHEEEYMLASEDTVFQILD